MTKTLINLGAGTKSAFYHLDPPIAPDGWREIKVDVDPGSEPDIVASLTDLKGHIDDQSADVVFCSHAIEHVNDHEVAMVFSEVARILKPTGFSVFMCPDLGQVFKAADPEDLEKTIYNSPVGPISALDILYGHRGSIKSGHGYMAHKTGFTEKSLALRLIRAGFKEVRVQPGTSFDMIAVSVLERSADVSFIRQLFPDRDFSFTNLRLGAA